MIQLSNPYMTSGKIIALTIQTFVDKVALDGKIVLYVQLNYGTNVSRESYVLFHPEKIQFSE